MQIQQYPLHLLSSTENHNKLSEQELKFTQGYATLKEQHFKKSVLNQASIQLRLYSICGVWNLLVFVLLLRPFGFRVQFPERFQGLTQQTREEDMIPSPDLDAFVFARVLSDVGEVEMERSGCVQLFLLLLLLCVHTQCNNPFAYIF